MRLGEKLANNATFLDYYNYLVEEVSILKHLKKKYFSIRIRRNE